VCTETGDPAIGYGSSKYNHDALLNRVVDEGGCGLAQKLPTLSKTLRTPSSARECVDDAMMRRLLNGGEGGRRSTVLGIEKEGVAGASRSQTSARVGD